MTKQEFITLLRDKLSGLPQADIDERAIFYSEMIDDRVEDGISEEDAVEEMGSVDEIVSQIIAETPLAKIVKEKLKTKRGLKTWQIILLAVGSLVWVPLIISVFAVVLALWVCLWAVVISLWVVDVSLAVGSLGAFVSSIIFILKGNTLSGTFLLGTGLVCAGLFIFLLFGCKVLTKSSALLTKKIIIGIKTMFIGKEDEK